MRYFGSFNDFPLSGSQKAIWLGEKLDPETNAFRIPLLIEILGPLNKKALKKKHPIPKIYNKLKRVIN